VINHKNIKAVYCEEEYERGTAAAAAADECHESLCCVDAAGGGIIQWCLDYNACDVLVGEVHALLNQVSHGAGMFVSVACCVCSVTFTDCNDSCLIMHITV